jgi:hypothetical protein
MTKGSTQTNVLAFMKARSDTKPMKEFRNNLNITWPTIPRFAKGQDAWVTLDSARQEERQVRGHLAAASNKRHAISSTVNSSFK